MKTMIFSISATLLAASVQATPVSPISTEQWYEANDARTTCSPMRKKYRGKLINTPEAYAQMGRDLKIGLRLVYINKVTAMIESTDPNTRGIPMARGKDECQRLLRKLNF